MLPRRNGEARGLGTCAGGSEGTEVQITCCGGGGQRGEVRVRECMAAGTVLVSSFEAQFVDRGRAARLVQAQAPPPTSPRPEHHDALPQRHNISRCLPLDPPYPRTSRNEAARAMTSASQAQTPATSGAESPAQILRRPQPHLGAPWDLHCRQT
jgi:hypothetical protein